jgi:hypothetical protein
MKVRLRLVLPAVLAATTLAAPAAHAGLVSGLTGALLPTCGATSQPFAQFGDTNSYYALSNNGFESGSTGWTLSGAGISKDNEPWFASGPGRYALALPPGASATSPSVCINLLDPFFRMFAKSMSANGDLRAQIVLPRADREHHRVPQTSRASGAGDYRQLEADEHGFRRFSRSRSGRPRRS